VSYQCHPGTVCFFDLLNAYYYIRSAMKFQKLYLVGLQKQDLNVGKVAEAFLLASWDALILFFLTMFAFQVRSKQ